MGPTGRRSGELLARDGLGLRLEKRPSETSTDDSSSRARTLNSRHVVLWWSQDRLYSLD